jgi:hypothetical protein
VEGDDAASWLVLHQALAAAFAPASADVELRFMVGGTEYLMLGRPRMVDPDISLLEVGVVVTAAAFVALDPAIYSADQHQTQLTLPSDSGGVSFPATFPATIDATITAGRADITNAGTRTTGLVLRIDGPVQEPRVTLLTDDGPAVLRYFGDLEAGQWLDVNTKARTVYLNGTASRRGLTGGDWPLLPPGTHELAFDAGLFDADALLTATWRDAWQ